MHNTSSTVQSPVEAAEVGRPAKDPELVALGRRISAQRRARGWTQRDLGLRASVNVGSIGHVEQGAQNPGLLNLLKIARGLEMPASKLLDGLPKSTPQRAN